MRVLAEHYNLYEILLILVRKRGRRARDICIVHAELVMLNLGKIDLRKYLSATPSRSSTATTVTQYRIKRAM